jgi:hypothetical protein
MAETVNDTLSTLPLTLPLRGSLPLPARGERAGVRGFL